MELITILVMSVTILAFLAILLRFNCNNIRLIKQIGEDNKLNEINMQVSL